jgi:hypothetical protein
VEMTEYLQTGSAPVVEASAITGAGVTATLRAAISRILDNLKKKVDTSLQAEAALVEDDAVDVSALAVEEPRLSPQAEPAAQAAADVPFFGSPAEVPFVAPLIQQEPFASASQPEMFAPEPGMFEPPPDLFPPDESAPIQIDPVDSSFDPFGQNDDISLVDVASATEIVEPPASPEVAEPIGSDLSYGRADQDLEELLANSRAVIRSLETALERARENERAILDRLAR